MSSPPGQFDEVLSDVKALLPPSLISPEMLTGIARAYNSRHCVLVKVGDKDVPICKEAEIDATKYIDSTSERSNALRRMSHLIGSRRGDPETATFCF